MRSGFNPHLWIVILAAGEGSRVSRFTHDRWGHSAPKQFSSIDGRKTLLESSIARARRIAPRERITAVVAARHRRWWTSELIELPQQNIVIQPENRGTAAGILLPVLAIVHRDHDAIVVLLPSDHFVESEETLELSLRAAVSAVRTSRVPLVLLGIEPQQPEEDYGWILPCSGCDQCPCDVRCFLEKPDLHTAASLVERGALLNSFIMVADSHRLLALFRQHLPQLSRPFELLAAHHDGDILQRGNLAELYESIPSLDFSADVLQHAAGQLSVCTVPPCGWTDLGTPRRLASHLVSHGPQFGASAEVTQGRDESPPYAEVV